MTNYRPKLTISETANPKLGAWFFFGIPVLVLILSLRFPFFQHVFTFGTFLLTVLMAMGCSAAYDDKKKNVERVRPKPENRFNPPKWFKPTFFIAMIALSAGLRLGWYLVPLCWIVIWICIESIASHVRAGYPKEDKDEEDNNS